MADHAADPGHVDPNQAAAAAAAAANQWASGLAAGNPYLPQVSIQLLYSSKIKVDNLLVTNWWFLLNL